MTILIPQQAGTDRQPPTAPRTWLAIRSLSARHRARIVTHLTSLSEQDRYLRFGHAATDNQIGRYVEQIDFARDEVFGIFNRRLQLVAMAHLASLTTDAERPGSAEFGVTVAQHLRGRGIGARLFSSACLHARNRGIDTLIVHALTENKAMLSIAKSAGAIVEYDGPDSTAVLRLPPENLSSHLSQLVEMQAGELDYGFKSHALQADRVLHAMLGLADKP